MALHDGQPRENDHLLHVEVGHLLGSLREGLCHGVKGEWWHSLQCWLSRCCVGGDEVLVSIAVASEPDISDTRFIGSLILSWLRSV